MNPKKKFEKRMEKCFNCWDSLLKIHLSKIISYEELSLLKDLQMKEFKEVCKEANKLKLKQVKIWENIDEWLVEQWRTSWDYRRTFTIWKKHYYFYIWEEKEDCKKILVRWKHPDYCLYFKEIPNNYLIY